MKAFKELIIIYSSLKIEEITRGMSVWAKVRHDTMYGPPEIGVYQCEVHFVDEENKRVLVYHNYTLQWVEIKDINNI